MHRKSELDYMELLVLKGRVEALKCWLECTPSYEVKVDKIYKILGFEEESDEREEIGFCSVELNKCK